MQVTMGTWHMREQCVPGSLSSSPAQEPGNDHPSLPPTFVRVYGNISCLLKLCRLYINQIHFCIVVPDAWAILDELRRCICSILNFR